MLALTERQIEAATLASEGLTNAQIAVRMGVEISTVKLHLHNAIQRTGVNGRLGLAVHLGLIRKDDIA